MSEVRDLTIRGPIDRAVEAVILEDGTTEVSVRCFGMIVAFQLPTSTAGDQLAIAVANAVHDARKADVIAAYAHPSPPLGGFADELEPAL
jgi:hypothetical protein